MHNFEGVKFKLLTLALAACVPVAAALSGASLASYIADRFRPAAAPSAAPPASWWSGESERMAVIPAEWWYADAPADAFNELLGPPALAAARGAYMPAQVVRPTQEGQGWAVGIAIVGGAEVNAWMPADDRRGDLARRLMYLAVIYPQRLWRSHGTVLLEDGGWPLLRPLGSDLLLQWHRSDPVDDRERAECALQGQRQGNVNPFVEYPDLAEYLWGSRAGEDFEVPADPPTPPDNPDPPTPPDPPGPVEPDLKPVPLKATYSVAADSLLWFTSPYVPSDAAWKLDGVPVEDDRISLSDVGIGVHELSFTSRTARGVIKIEIRP